MAVAVRPLVEPDRERWAELYSAYAAFYEMPVPDLDHLWRRITELGEVECLVAQLDDELGSAVVGFAHVRPYARPLDGDTAGWLDDLFVDPACRGGGVGAALLAHLRGIARERGWGTVTWITAADNAVAQGLYDRVADRTSWVTYEMAPDDS